MKTTIEPNIIDSKYLRQIKKARSELKYNRKNFWKKNQVNFLNNIKTIISFFEFPEKWTVNVIASRFLLDKESMPYDNDVWSFSDVVSATEDIGYNIILFFNRTDLEFLSAPAILPLVVHEIAHVYQAAREPETYVTSSIDKELNKEYEKEAEAEEKKFSDEFRKQNVLEKVLYCYDKKGWKGAKKMVQFAREEVKDAFGGGYDEDLTEEEYKIFQKAEEEKDMDIFIDYFIDSLKEKEEEEVPTLIKQEVETK
ncbi:hypothetical protein J4218_00030 [Candidatus Pacearchaeota archaeon]|nr:hypothetical protein [Candidatus Pacearchaeota archaeon]